MNTQAQTQANTQTKQNNSVVVGGRTYTHVSTDRRYLARILTTELANSFAPVVLASLTAGEENEIIRHCTKEFLAPIGAIQFEPVPEVDWTQVEVDTLIWVRDRESDHWQKRHFAKFDPETKTYYSWNNGRSSQTVHAARDFTGWIYASLTDPEAKTKTQ